MVRQSKPQTFALGSIGVGLLVLALKYAAYLVTGSIALYSDALESIINVVTATAAFLALRLSARPPDANHPYGHYKAEYFSAVLAGALIIVAAFSILQEAWRGFLDPRPLDAPVEGLLVNGLASLLNGGWSWVLISQGRRQRSPALAADGRHLLTDVMTSVGVLVGVVLVVVTGWQVLDPAIAALVAVNILWAGWQLMRESTGGLMDEGLSDKALTRIRHALETHAAGAIQAHDLRTRRAGPISYVDFHLVVEAGMTVGEAHAICDRLERAIATEVPGARVTIHVEPGSKSKRPAIVFR